MKVRRITLEVDIPFEYDGAYVLSTLGVGFGERCEDIPYQAQVASETLSTNDRIGDVTEWPPVEVKAKEWNGRDFPVMPSYGGRGTRY